MHHDHNRRSSANPDVSACLLFASRDEQAKLGVKCTFELSSFTWLLLERQTESCFDSACNMGKQEGNLEGAWRSIAWQAEARIKGADTRHP